MLGIMHRQRSRLAGNTAALLAVAAALALVGGSAAVAFARARHRPSIEPVAQDDSPYRVVGLGDSVPAGSACGCTSYVSLVAAQAASERSRTADVSNLARPGLTSAGLQAQIGDRTVRAELAAADLVIVTIGANDFDESRLASSDCPAASCYQDTLAAQRTTLSAILGEVSALHPGGDAAVLVTGYWNVFRDGQVGRDRGSAYVRASDDLTVADNALIAAVATAQGDTYVDIYTPFKGGDDTGLLAGDGDHPNAAGHALIARTLLQALG
jgi:lysophospholipase L1-like esterase